MEIFHSFQEITGFTGAVVALGTFDGVHRGHQMVMKTAIKRAAACGVKTMVVTFTAHPLSVLCPEKEPLRLATIGQKAEYIEAVGIDGLVLLPMSQTLLQESPEEFCQNLLTYIHPSAIVVGSNFTYGAKAAGNTETMKFFMSQYGIPVVALTLLERPGRTTPISSTVIRRLIQMGHMETAENLLGRPFALTGTIVPGDRRGRTIGFATANMLIPINADAVPDSCVPTALIASAPPTVPMPLQNAMVKNNATSAGMGNCIHAHKTVSNAHKIAAIRPPRNNVIALIRRARREKIHEAMISPVPLRPNTRLNCIGLKPNSFCNTNDEEPIYANKPASIKL